MLLRIGLQFARSAHRLFSLARRATGVLRREGVVTLARKTVRFFAQWSQQSAPPGPSISVPIECNPNISALAGPGPAMLFVTHSWGGGTERYARELAAGLEAEGVRVLFLRTGDAGALRLERFSESTAPAVVFQPAREYDVLLATLKQLGVGHVHVHHLICHGPATRRLIHDLGVPYDVTLVDHYLACPRIHMMDENGRYCGGPSPAECNRCLAQRGDNFGQRDIDITRYRQSSAEVLAAARRVFLIHAEMRSRVQRIFPGIEFTVRPPAEIIRGARPVFALPTPDSALRVAILGAIQPHKGLSLLLACGRDAIQRGLPIEFRVLGWCECAAELVAPSILVTGPYREEEVFDRLAAQACHCALFLSTVPETHSYTLSVAFAGGLYAFGLEMGALAPRIREHGWGEVIPFDASPGTINDRLIAARPRLAQGGPAFSLSQPRYDSILREYYGMTWPPQVLGTNRRNLVLETSRRISLPMAS